MWSPAGGYEDFMLDLMLISGSALAAGDWAACALAAGDWATLAWVYRYFSYQGYR